MKVAVIGSRGFDDQEKLYRALDSYHNKQKIDLIISGGAVGADQLAEQYAKERGIPVKIFKPDYAKHGRGAPIRRNTLIIENADIVLAFWDGKSPGTKNSLDQAKKLNKLYQVYDF